jgi:hypothetical protein
LCATSEQLDWLRDRVLAEWSEWRGPGQLRELFASRFKPADEGQAAREARPFTTPRYEEIRDASGNVLAVRFLPGSAPLALPAADTDARTECREMLSNILSAARSMPRGLHAVVKPHPACGRCNGNGWLDTDAGIRCECTFAPVREKTTAQLEAELEAAKTPGRHEQEHEAEVAVEEAKLMKLNPNYRPPNRAGRHQGVVLGAERFLLQ